MLRSLLRAKSAYRQAQLLLEQFLLEVHLRQPDRLSFEDLGDCEQVADLSVGKISTGRPGRSDEEPRAFEAEQPLQVELERGFEIARVGEALPGSADRIGQQIGRVAGLRRDAGLASAGRRGRSP